MTGGEIEVARQVQLSLLPKVQPSLLVRQDTIEPLSGSSLPLRMLPGIAYTQAAQELLGATGRFVDSEKPHDDPSILILRRTGA